MKKIILTIVILFASFIYAQVENSDKFSQAQPNYYQDFLNFASDQPGMTRTDIFIQVPYSEVQFVLSEGNFTANYTVSVSVFDENKEKLLTEKSWVEKLETKNFDQTTSRNNFNISLRSFQLKPGKYLIRTAVEDKESSRNYVSENVFLVRDLSGSFAVSDILLLAKSVTEGINNKILPNVSRTLAVTKTGIPIFMEFYSSSKRNIKVEYSIQDGEKKNISQVFETQAIDSGTNKIYYTFKDTSLSLGSYIMNVSVKGTDGENIASASKSFNSRWAGIPLSIQDLDKAIQQMVYIATEDEMDYIKETENKDEKVKRYLAFWKKKDPVPESEDNEIFIEYYRRVDYATKNFSHYSEGWKTDRGMVFIILGAPNNVDRHPFDYDSKPYEIWEYYNLNRNFVFVDETGFGDYRLITPMYGDNYRFR